MKLNKKIMAIILSLVFVTGVFTACQDNNQEVYQTESYAATVEINFSSENEALKQAIAAMSTSGIICVDGDDLKVETEAKVGDTTVEENYVFFGGMLYHKQVVSSGDLSNTVLERTNLKDEERQQLLSDIGAGANISYLDFNIQDMEGDETNGTYICSRITAKAKESLEKIYGSNFKGFGQVELDGAEYTLVVENGREEKSTLTCHFVVTMEGESYEITMQIVTDYDYDASFSIVIPANSASYKQVLYSEIFG